MDHCNPCKEHNQHLIDTKSMPGIWLCDEKHKTRSKMVHDVSNLKVYQNCNREYIYPYQEGESDDDFAVHPSEMINECIELILMRHKKKHIRYFPNEDFDDDNSDHHDDALRFRPENLQFVKEIWNLLKKNTVYMILDIAKVGASPEYTLHAVVVMEPYVLIAEKKSPIIHLAACHFQYDATTHLETLMLHIFSNDYFKQFHSLFIKSMIGSQYISVNKDDPEMKTCNIAETMKKIGFNDAEKGCLFELVHEDSKVMSCDRKTINQGLSTMFKKDQSYRVVSIDRVKKVFAYYHKNQFSFFSHAFGWNQATMDDMSLLNQREQRVCMKSKGAAFILKGSGYRLESIGRIRSYQIVCGNHTRFYQNYYITESNCAWLSAAMLIYQRGRSIGRYMTDLLKKNPNKYDWLALMKVPKDRVQMNHWTLQSLLQKDKKINYCLKKVPETMPYLDMMLDPTTTGQYICQLCTKAGSESHVIGIDCDDKRIYDCMEKYVFHLTLENIDYCCGPNENGIKKFIRCLEIVRTQKPNKQKKK